MLFFYHFECLCAISGRSHDVPLGEHLRDIVSHFGVIFDNEEGRAYFVVGLLMGNGFRSVMIALWPATGLQAEE